MGYAFALFSDWHLNTKVRTFVTHFMMFRSLEIVKPGSSLERYYKLVKQLLIYPEKTANWGDSNG